MATTLEAAVGRTALVYAEIVRLTLAGRLSADAVEQAMWGIIHSSREFGPIVFAAAFLHHVSGSRDSSNHVNRAERYLTESGLTEREQWIMRLRFGMEGDDPWGHDALSRRFGLTTTRVKSVIQTATGKIQEAQDL